MEKYEIIDVQTQQRVGTTYTNRRRASTRADKLDLNYGAYRYTVRPVPQVFNADEMRAHLATLDDVALSHRLGIVQAQMPRAQKFKRVLSELQRHESLIIEARVALFGDA